jgi:ATP-dependent DNA ligase
MNERAVLTQRLGHLLGGSGFTGKAPGGLSRLSTERSGEWEPVRPELVVEVRFDQVTGNRFRRGTKLLRWPGQGATPMYVWVDRIVEGLLVRLVHYRIG